MYLTDILIHRTREFKEQYGSCAIRGSVRIVVEHVLGSGSTMVPSPYLSLPLPLSEITVAFSLWDAKRRKHSAHTILPLKVGYV